MPRWADIAVIGEINPDVIFTGVPPMSFGQREDFTGPTTITVGSSAAVTACGLARLGTNTAIVGVVEDDAFGDFMMSRLGERRVDVSAGSQGARGPHRVIGDPRASRGSQRPAHPH